MYLSASQMHTGLPKDRLENDACLKSRAKTGICEEGLAAYPQQIDERSAGLLNAMLQSDLTRRLTADALVLSSNATGETPASITCNDEVKRLREELLKKDADLAAALAELEMLRRDK